MYLSIFVRAALMSVSALVVLTGCVVTQMPVAEHKQPHLQPIQDLRPQLLFATDTQDQLDEFKVYVNALYVGTVADFSSENRPLRLLSGEHTIQIKVLNEVRWQKTLVLENGAVRRMYVPHIQRPMRSDA